MAGATGLEPATSGSTVRSSNQLSYAPTSERLPKVERYSNHTMGSSQAKSKKKIRIGIVSLGCPKTLVDSEIVLGALGESRFAVVRRVEESDVVLLNTCGFIRDAKDESIDYILGLLEQKKLGRLRAVIVMGCFVQRYAADLQKNFPEVDAFLGSGDYDQLTRVLKSVLNGKRSMVTEHLGYLGESHKKRVALTPKFSRYLKISEGCNHTCSFCVIPQIRGRFRSRTIADVEKEAKLLVQKGAKEIILIGQDITQFGCDYAKKPMLSELLEVLERIDGLGWIRLLYAYPNSVSDSLIHKIAESRKICHYLDLPLQHISDNILTAMRRGFNRQKTRELIQKLRREIPDLTLRTSFIVGFPGETEKDFQELLDFVSWARFERVGVFKYSQEEGTLAAKMRSQVPEKVKERRYHELMLLQRGIAEGISKKQVGREMKVLIEEKTVSNTWKGRTAMDAPEIDPYVIVVSARALRKGTFYPVRITGAKGYDLLGKI